MDFGQNARDVHFAIQFFLAIQNDEFTGYWYRQGAILKLKFHFGKNWTTPTSEKIKIVMCHLG